MNLFQLRKPREGEVEGVNYFFLSEDEFKNLIENNGLLEYAVYNNCYYGTPIKGVNDAISNGKICVLIIDVQGAENVKKLYPDSVSIFLVPPNWETLEQRLRARNSEEEEMIQKRLNIAKKELLCQDEYDYKVVNDNLDDCVNDIEKILCEELKKRNESK